MRSFILITSFRPFLKHLRVILQRLQPELKFSSIILVEPLLSPQGAEHLQQMRSKLIRGARERRDVWHSRDSARDHLREKAHTWDSRVLDAYIVRLCFLEIKQS